MTLRKSNPWRRRAPPTTLEALPSSHPGTWARKPPLESLDPLSTTYWVDFAQAQRVTLYFNPADAVTYEVDDLPYGYDDVEVPAVTRAEVHSAAGGGAGESTEDYLVPGQDH